MAGQKGRDVLAKVDNGSGSFITIGGMRSKSISLNSETVDITDGESANQWRELLENAGVKSATISGSGVFKDSAGEERVRSLFFSQAHEDFQFIIPSFGIISGLFQVTTIEYAGDYNGEANYSMTYESAGALTYSAI